MHKKFTTKHLQSGFTWWELMIVVIVVLLVSWCTRPSPSPEVHVRAHVSKAKNELRLISGALETYVQDHGALPPVGPLLSDTAENPSSVTIPEHLTAVPKTLTTPLPYLPTWNDPWAPTEAGRVSYAFVPLEGEGLFLLISAGPDQDYDFDPVYQLIGGNRALSRNPLPLIYDPTNGLISDGDIIRTHHGLATPDLLLELTSFQSK